LCDSSSCKTVKTGLETPLKAVLPVPAEKAGDDKRRADNNGFAIGLASDYFSGVVVAFIENLLGAAPPAAAATEAPVINALGGKCLDVPYGKFADGTLMQVWACGPGNPNQQFTMVDGQLKSHGFCVDAYGGSGNPGDKIGLSQCKAGVATQKWALQDNRLKGINGRCIGIGGADPNDGAGLVLWDCNGSPDQSWRR
jgi:hypothetical protein